MKRLGILTALIPEAVCLAEKPMTDQVIQLSDGIMLYVCGMGAERARQGVARLLEDGADALMSVGTAGGLDTVLNPGDVLLPEHILQSDGRRMAVHGRWRNAAVTALTGAGVPVHGGDLLQVNEVIRNAEEKRKSHAQTGAVAVDMESFAVAEEADRYDIPALVIRVIVDTADTVVPDAVLNNSDVYGRPRIMGLAGSLFLRPRQIMQLLHLARCFRTAAGRLQQVGKELHRLVPPD